MTINPVELVDVDVTYRSKAVLKGLSHRFDVGCHLIEGPNGVGKSTLLGSIAGHVPYGGSIRIRGKDLRKDPVDARAGLCYVPDAPIFHPFVTGQDFIAFLVEAHRLSLSSRQDRFDSLVHQFDLGPHLATRFSQASLGTRRKFFLVATFVIFPDVLILDEPFNGLDSAATSALLKLLEQASVDRVILLTCHQPSIVESLSLTRWTLAGSPGASLLRPGRDQAV